MANVQAVAGWVGPAVEADLFIFRQFAQAFFVSYLINGTAPGQLINNIHLNTSKKCHEERKTSQNRLTALGRIARGTTHLRA